jgi:hypothetical protein
MSGSFTSNSDATQTAFLFLTGLDDWHQRGRLSFISFVRCPSSFARTFTCGVVSGLASKQCAYYERNSDKK